MHNAHAHRDSQVSKSYRPSINHADKIFQVGRGVNKLSLSATQRQSGPSVSITGNFFYKNHSSRACWKSTSHQWRVRLNVSVLSTPKYGIIKATRLQVKAAVSWHYPCYQFGNARVVGTVNFRVFRLVSCWKFPVGVFRRTSTDQRQNFKVHNSTIDQDSLLSGNSGKNILTFLLTRPTNFKTTDPNNLTIV